MKIVGFGDLLIHFSPIMDQRLMQAELMQMSFTGAEANVCAALALWGERVELVTRLPRHALADKAVSFFRGLGVTTEHVARGDGRMGIYFLEKGAGVRSSGVIYDRADSAFTKSKFEDYDFNAALEGADALYVSGITPVLSDSLSDCCERLAALARSRGLRVFYDVNLRPSLCDLDTARQKAAKILPYVTDLIGNEEHLKSLFAISSSYGENECEARLRDLIDAVREQTGIPRISVTVRRTISASEVVFYAAHSDGDAFALSRSHRTLVVDRVGSGDSFSAGIVYAASQGYDCRDTVDFAAAACILKHTIGNDVCFAGVDEIRSLAAGQGRDVRR